MKLEYYGHSCFKLIGEDGLSVLFDPFGGIGYELPKGISSDAVLVSHGHFDHANVSAVKNSQVFLGETNVDYKYIKISSIKSYHDEVFGKKRGDNYIFIVEMEGKTVCHLGDIGMPVEQFDFSKLPKIDVLLIPVGGNYTIDGKTAVKYVEKINPKIVIPMHYKTRFLNVDVHTEEEFMENVTNRFIETYVGEYDFSKDTDNFPKVIIIRRAE